MRNINQTLLSKARTSIFIAHRCVFPVWSEMTLASLLIVKPPRVHRLKTVADADLLIVLKDGYVAEQGTHSQLMAKEGGLYRSMWDQQNEMIHEQIEELEELEGEEEPFKKDVGGGGEEAVLRRR